MLQSRGLLVENNPRAVSIEGRFLPAEKDADTASITKLDQALLHAKKMRRDLEKSLSEKLARHDANPTYDVALAELRTAREELEKRLKGALDAVAASLAYNKLSILGGFAAFDADHDGLVSLEDMQKSLVDIECELTDSDLAFLHLELDKDGDGFLNVQEWTGALRRADVIHVLQVCKSQSAGLGLCHCESWCAGLQFFSWRM